MIQLLLNQGVPTLEEDNAGMTALHLASKHGQLDSIGVLKGNIPYGVISNKVRKRPSAASDRKFLPDINKNTPSWSSF